MTDTEAHAGSERPRILIADDEADLRMILEMKLARASMDVTVARDGLEARELARSRQWDLAVFDVMMPGLSGLELVRELRDDGFDRPVLLLSAKATDEEIDAGYEAGCTAYVTKPFSPADLLVIIQDLLAGRTGPERAQPSP